MNIARFKAIFNFLVICSAKINDKVVLQCDGNNGTCSATIKKWGQTASVDCSGQKVDVAD
jgi:hypothetical protein